MELDQLLLGSASGSQPLQGAVGRLLAVSSGWPLPPAAPKVLHPVGGNYHLRMFLHCGLAELFQGLLILHQFKPLF